MDPGANVSSLFTPTLIISYMLGEDRINFNLFSIDMDIFFSDELGWYFLNIYTFERMYARLEIQKKRQTRGSSWCAVVY